MGDRQTDTPMSHQARRSPEESDFAKRLGNAVRNGRIAAGLTQDQVAASANLSRASIANIERGTQTPQVFRLALLARALKCDVADLVPPIDSMDADLLPEASRKAYADVLRIARTSRQAAG